MEGVKNDPVLKGVIPNSFEHIFSEISRTQGKQFLVRASYLEIYSEDIRDLISSKHTQRLQLREKVQRISRVWVDTKASKKRSVACRHF